MYKGVLRARRAAGSGLLALGCLVAATGCYNYQVVTPSAVGPGARIRAQLSNEAVLRLEPVLGTLQREVKGEVIESDGRRLLLLARSDATLMAAETLGATQLRATGQRIALEQQEILALEERYLARGKSAAFSAMVASGLVASAIYFFTGRSKGRNTTGPVDGPEL
jgi:hypothetical protein